MSPSPAVPALGPEWEQVVKPPPPTLLTAKPLLHTPTCSKDRPRAPPGPAVRLPLLHRLRPSGVSLL